MRLFFLEGFPNSAKWVSDEKYDKQRDLVPHINCIKIGKTLALSAMIFAVSCEPKSDKIGIEIDLPSPLSSAQNSPPPPPAKLVERKVGGGNYGEYGASNASFKQIEAGEKAKQNAPLIAYNYSMRLQSPNDKLIDLMQSHSNECVQAGFDKCRVLASSSQNNNNGKSASLSIQATPDWITNFKSQLQTNSKKTGIKILESETNSEDLTAYITDNDIALKSKIELRTKIQEIIRNHKGSLGELLEAETRLADVQNEIESIESDLKSSRTRIEMSQLDLNYQTSPNIAKPNAMAPLKSSFLGFISNFTASLASLIDMFARFLPFGIIFGGAIYLLAKRLNRKPR